MKQIRIILSLLILAFGVMPAVAQKHGPKNQNRKEWMAKMRELKHDFMAKELQLSDSQKAQFFEVYDKCEDARHNIEHEAREKEKALEKKGDAATDAELDALIADQFSMEERLGKVDQQYLPQFRKVLTRRQLARLKHAERKFMRKLMDKKNENCPPPPGK
ncbi:MAG: Spy/CpxP family protein refolding chaperone [Muribaculaceae bacterium]|nr:Spy/CpxP family protein refolding chaperone [Muribaculaceae bacterium]